MNPFSYISITSCETQKKERINLGGLFAPKPLIDIAGRRPQKKWVKFLEKTTRDRVREGDRRRSEQSTEENHAGAQPRWKSKVRFRTG